MNTAINPNLIAITGMGCRYPGGANDVQSFWDLLKQGKQVLTDVPASRFDIERLYSESEKSPGTIRSRKGGFIDNLGSFDADFFNISPREAISMDPQQRLLLECGFEALEDAGMTLDQIKGSDASVYIGSFNSDYETLMFQSLRQIDLYSVIGGGRYSMSNRLSYFFDLRGESMQIDTACSSSLVALNLACQQLRSGETELALIGGCNAIINPYLNIGLSYSQVLSKSGRCNFGGSERDGYARSEGVGVVVLRPLHVALRENNPIYAVVLASGVNNDGKSSGLLLFPSAPLQSELMEKVWRRAGVDKDEVGYVEAHGTGTKAGDPVELEAIGARLQGRSADAPRAYVGSVKSNIGHCEGGSAIASIVKTALMLKHASIVPSVVVGELCPELQAPDRPFDINAETIPWPRSVPDGGRRVAAINSFGMTGTNAHAVLASCQHANSYDPVRNQPRTRLIPLTAKSDSALKARIASLLKWSSDPDQAPNFYDLGYTLALRRNLFDKRIAIAANNLQQFQAGLQNALVKLPSDAPEADAPGADAPGADARPNELVFVYAGHGGQWPGMGRQLYAAEAVFKDALDHCDAIIQEQAQWSLLEKLHAEGDDGIFASTRFLQPAIFAIHVGVTLLLRHYGIVPKAVLGHSVGEIAAAWASGACTLETACTIVLERSRLMDQAQLSGKMLLVKAAPASLQGKIMQCDLDIACINGPQEFVVSGSLADIDSFAAMLNRDGITHFQLQVQLPFHSRYYAPAAHSLETVLEGVLGDIRMGEGASTCDFYSTVSGKKEALSRLDAAYWAANVRSCVQFQAAVESAAQDNYRHFIEIGSHPVLIHALHAILPQHPGSLFSTLRKDQDLHAFHQALGQLFCHGLEVNFAAMYLLPGACLNLPPYPFDKQHYWIKTATRSDAAAPDALARRTAVQESDEKLPEGSAKGSAKESPNDSPAKSAPARRAQSYAEVKQTVRHLVLDTLHRDAIGDNDAFMSMGMDSLMAIGLCSQLETTLGVSIDYRNFWLHASVQRLTDLIQGAAERRNKPLARSLLALHGNADAPNVLVCFHCAGGNPAMFFDWKQVLAPDMALLAIQVAGRGELYDEARPASIRQWIAAVGPYFFERLGGRQFYFAGHSMGAILAYEMAQYLATQHHIVANKLFILAGMAPAAASSKTDFVHGAKDNLDTLFPSYNQAMDQRIKDDLLALLLADLGLLDAYRLVPDKLVPLNIISLGGLQDQVVSAQDMAGWAGHALQCELHMIEADHISILRAEAALSIIRQHLNH